MLYGCEFGQIWVVVFYKFVVVIVIIFDFVEIQVVFVWKNVVFFSVGVFKFCGMGLFQFFQFMVNFFQVNFESLKEIVKRFKKYDFVYYYENFDFLYNINI